MDRQGWYRGILLAVAVVFVLGGCSRRDDEGLTEAEVAEPQTPVITAPPVDESSTEDPAPASGPAPQAPVESEAEEQISENGPFAKALAVWNEGRTDQAVRDFLAIDWAATGVFAGVPALTTSEAQLARLSLPEQQRFLADAMEKTSAMRKLAFEVVAAARERAAAGDYQTARSHFEAIGEYGRALAQPERLELIRLHGQAVVGYAEKQASETLPGDGGAGR
jgi:hypothetical protein